MKGLKKFLIGILVVLLLLVNGIAVYGLLDTFVLAKKEKEETEQIEKEESEQKEEQQSQNSGEIRIGLSEEVLREREEAQRQLEELQQKTKESLSISDEFGEKLKDLANPLIEKETMDSSEYTVKDIVDNKIVVIDPKTGFYGVIDFEKNPIIPFKYQDIRVTEDNYFLVKEDGKVGILDSDGLQLLSPDYNSIEELVRGYYLAKMADGANIVSKVFNRNGDEVFSVNKNVVSVLKENANYFLFQENGKYGIVDIMGEVRLPANYDQLILKDSKLYYKIGTEIGVME